MAKILDIYKRVIDFPCQIRIIKHKKRITKWRKCHTIFDIP